jgi:sugar phosphate permease
VVDGTLGGGAGRRSAFYGWYVVASAAVIAFVAWGVAFWNIGVFLYAFHEAYGWSRATLSASATLFSVVAGLTGLVAGRVVDRRGPRIVLIFGGAVTGLGMLGAGQVRELWQVYVCHAILAVGYGCIHVLVLSALLARWFRRKRALAMMLALTGSSVGGLVLVPLSTTLIAHYGITMAATTLGLVAWALVLPVAFFVVRDRPELKGLRPDGATESEATSEAQAADRLWTLGEALRTVVWWTITVAFMLTLMGQASYLIHQVSFLSLRLGLGGAGLAVAMTTGAGVIGRFALGWVGDRFPKRYLAVASFLLQAVGVLAAIGLTIALHPLMMVECFGVRSYGTVYGPGFLATQLGQAVGPLLVGVLSDVTGGYVVPFTVTASAAVAAACLLSLMPTRLPDVEGLTGAVPSRA